MTLQKQDTTLTAVADLLEQKRLDTLERILISMLKQVWALQGKRRKIVKLD